MDNGIYRKEKNGMASVYIFLFIAWKLQVFNFLCGRPCIFLYCGSILRNPITVIANKNINAENNLKNYFLAVEKLDDERHSFTMFP